MHTGGSKPRCIVDRLFNEETEIGMFEPDDRHAVLEESIKGRR